jgi:hypothetical protein
VCWRSDNAVVVLYISLWESGVFRVLSGYLLIFFDKVPIQTFLNLFFNQVDSLTSTFIYSGYSPLSHLCLTNIFSQAIARLNTFLAVSFEEPKVLIFMKPNFLPSWFLPFCVLSKKPNLAWWCPSVIPANQEAQAGGFQV